LPKLAPTAQQSDGEAQAAPAKPVEAVMGGEVTRAQPGGVGLSAKARTDNIMAAKEKRETVKLRGMKLVKQRVFFCIANPFVTRGSPA
jgi:hypothetical protein